MIVAWKEQYKVTWKVVIFPLELRRPQPKDMTFTLRCMQQRSILCSKRRKNIPSKGKNKCKDSQSGRILVGLTTERKVQGWSRINEEEWRKTESVRATMARFDIWPGFLIKQRLNYVPSSNTKIMRTQIIALRLLEVQLMSVFLKLSVKEIF